MKEENKEKHTPGPWVLNDEDPSNLKVECAFYEDETPGICGSHSKEWPLTEDDARLIIAAPRLLKALARLMDQPTMNPLSMTPDQRAELWAAHDEARTVFAAAAGYTLIEASGG
jgi:hypothetical protein